MKNRIGKKNRDRLEDFAVSAAPKYSIKITNSTPTIISDLVGGEIGCLSARN
jgi:hypothetical protein